MNQKEPKYEKHYTKTSELIHCIHSIHEQCNKFDGIHHNAFIDEEYKDYSNYPCAYTAIEHGKTVGFLCPYVIDRYNLEFCVFVLPENRRKQIASNLFFRMIHDFGKQSYRLSIHPQNTHGKKFVQQMGFTYGCCECSMILNKQDFIPATKKISLSAVKQEDKILITGLIDNIEVGHLEITSFDMTACIHDVEIKENLRRNGYGVRMVSSALMDIFEKYDQVILHVTKENIPAYGLYQKIGFHTLDELDYYEL